MRILHLLNHTRRLNGHVHAAVDLACAQRAMGHTVQVASEGGDFDQLLADNDIETFTISHERRVGRLAHSTYRLVRHLREHKIDVVHAHMMTSAVIGRIACTATRISLVTTLHNEFERSAILMGLGHRVIAVSEAVRLSMAQRGIPMRKLDVVLNGTIGAARLKNRSRKPKQLQYPAILFVGGLHPRKGLPDLLQAFDLLHAQYPSAHLYIVGDGPHREEYQALANGMACAPAVTYAGPQLEPFAWMLGADIFVLPSLADPAPLVLPEAREAGCAIVASDVGGIPQLLEYGEAGLLVQPQDPAALAGVLARLIANPAELDVWKTRSQRNIAQLTIERVAHETLGVYEAASRPHGR